MFPLNWVWQVVPILYRLIPHTISLLLAGAFFLFIEQL